MSRTKVKKIGLGDASGGVRDYKTEITYNEDTKTFNIYMLDIITDTKDYSNVFDVFANVSEEESIHIYLSTRGGSAETTIALIGAGNRSQAKVIKVICGEVASAGTILAIAFDELDIMDNAHFMIHNYSSGEYGKAHELYAAIDFAKRHMTDVFKSFYQDFLTEPEMEDIIKGQDLYLTAPEVRERWKNVIAKRQEYIINMQKSLQEEQDNEIIEYLRDKGYEVNKEPLPIINSEQEIEVPQNGFIVRDNTLERN